MSNRKSQIRINVKTNENNVPESIHWTAEDGGVENAHAKAMMLALWDDETILCALICGTKMTVDEMKQFVHQTLLTMADSFERATGEHNISEDLRDYCHHFADKMNILP